MNTISNPLQACLRVFTHPNQVFAAINKHNNWSWIAFLLVMTATLLPLYVYYQYVDFAWLKDFHGSFLAKDVSPAEREIILTPFASQKVYTLSNLFAFFVGTILLNAVIAAYLNVMTKSDEENVNGFTDWYGFIWWVQLPSVVVAIVVLLMILVVSDDQRSMYALQPLSMAFWLGLDEQSKWVGFADLLRLDLFFNFYLLITGLHQWTRLSSLRIYLTSFVPFIVLTCLSLAATIWWI